MTQTLVVNGDTLRYEQGEFPSGLAALATALGLDPAMLVAEVNGEIIRRDSFARHALADGDTVELVRFVGGG